MEKQTCTLTIYVNTEILIIIETARPVINVKMKLVYMYSLYPYVHHDIFRRLISKFNYRKPYIHVQVFSAFDFWRIHSNICEFIYMSSEVEVPLYVWNSKYRNNDIF